MKIKLFLGFVISLILLTGCSEGDDVGSLSNIQLDKTYLSIPETGGSATVNIVSSENWSMGELPEWLSASQTSGAAGTQTVTFSADATSGGREAEVTITIGDKSQFVLVRQGSLEAVTATCAEIIAGPDGKTFRVKGTCTSIANISPYGNWYLEDATGQIYIYGTADKDGKLKNDAITSLGIEVGDVITVEGPKTTYNGTVELVDVTVINVEKSLIKIITDDITMPKEGGELDVKVAYKGNGAFLTIPNEAAGWVTYVSTEYIAGQKTLFETNPADTAVFKFQIAPNTLETRRTAVTFSSHNSESKSSVMYNIVQKGMSNPPTGTGTEDDPYNVTAALDAAVAGATDVYIRGIVSTAPTSFTASYGNLGYYISADGKQEDQLQVYRGFSFGGEHFTSKDDIKVGDVVIIKGNLKLHNGSPEIDANNQLVMLNGQTSMEGINDAGSYRKPFSISEVISYIDSGATGSVFVKGKVSKLVSGGFSTSHGNGTFWISDDGNFYDDPLKDFEAYRVYWLANKLWVDGDDQIKVGDNVILCGEVTKYKTTYETNQNKAYVFSVNGKVK